MRNRNRHRYGNLLGYVDISMNLLMCFVVLFAFAYMLIRLQDSVTDSTRRLATTSKMVVHLSWDSKSDDDIDIWVRTENPGAVVGFKNRATANMFLDTDNLGHTSNAVAKSDGRYQSTYGNNENVMFKECSNTHVTVNVHFYRSQGYRTIPVKVELVSMEPFRTVHTAELVMDKPGQERTAMQFDLDEACGVRNISSAQLPFVLGEFDAPQKSAMPQGDR